MCGDTQTERKNVPTRERCFILLAESRNVIGVIKLSVHVEGNIAAPESIKAHQTSTTRSHRMNTPCYVLGSAVLLY